MLPDTAKALSAPLTKLVEVIAAGCGKVYGPTDKWHCLVLFPSIGGVPEGRGGFLCHQEFLAEQEV
jgi:hypothetical protein